MKNTIIYGFLLSVLFSSFTASAIEINTPSAPESVFSYPIKYKPWALTEKNVEVEIFKDNASFEIPERQHRVSVSSSETYTIKVVNKNRHRVYAVFEVDYINPLDGRKSYAAQSGKIIEGNSEIFLMGAVFKKNHSVTPSILPSPNTKDGKGYFMVAVFHEAPNYPLVLPGMETPPYSEDYFYTNEKGSRVWLPPKNYPFRKESSDYSKFNFQYETLN